MKVKEIMTAPVVTALPETRLKDVAQLLLERKIGAVPVVDRHGTLVGILSEADLVALELTPDPRLHPLVRLGTGPDRTPRTARELMTCAIVTVREDADVAEAAGLLLHYGHRSLPVLRAGQVVGILARRDLLQVLAR